MKLLIIGRNGQLGSTLINDAQLSGHTVISTSHQELDISYIINKNNIKFIRILKNSKPDIVVNATAYNNVFDCEKNQLYAFNINCVAVKNMAEITNELNIPFITFSSDYVFDGKTFNQYIETDTPHPLNIYGLSKLAGEYASLQHENATVIRTCGLYGLNSTSTKNGKGNFVDNRVKDSNTNLFIQIGCDQTVSPTYACDLSKAVLQLITHPIKKYNLYHLVNEGYCTWYEFTKEIYEILDIDTEVVPINRCGMDGTMKRPLFSALRNERAKELGITLPHWRDAIRRYLEIKYKNGLL